MERFELLVEAEHFQHYGGWVLDAQFEEEMGWPYLLAFVAATGGFRRYVGDYILTEEDIRNHTPFPDVVAVNSGAFCLHYPGNPKYSFRLGSWNWVERDFKSYDIPLRCLYSADMDNLFAAGKHISVTHIAGSSVKRIGNCGQHGMAVGTAAALCAKYGMTSRELGAEHMDELRLEIKSFVALKPKNREFTLYHHVKVSFSAPISK